MSCPWDWKSDLWKQTPFKKPTAIKLDNSEPVLNKKTLYEPLGPDSDDEDAKPKFVRGRPILQRGKKTPVGKPLRHLINEHCDIPMGNTIIEQMVKLKKFDDSNQESTNQIDITYLKN